MPPKAREAGWSVVKPLHVTWKCGVVGRVQERRDTSDHGFILLSRQQLLATRGHPDKL